MEDSRTSIYVKNIGEEIDEEYLKEIFSQYGIIRRLMVIPGKNGSSKFALISFCSIEEACRAVELTNGTMVGSRNVSVVLSRLKDVEELVTLQCLKRATGLPIRTRRGGINQVKRIINNSEIGSNWANRAKLINILISGNFRFQRGAVARDSNISKQALGDRLYPIVEAMIQENTDEVTGVLLQRYNDELVPLVNDTEKLVGKINEVANFVKTQQNLENKPVVRHLSTSKGS